jgi:predicted outer membrane protein
MLENPMTVRFALSTVAAVALMGVAACGDGRDDAVVRATDPTAATEQTAGPVPGDMADSITALGMNRDELEDADLRSADGADLGDVEAIIIDADNAVTGFAIDLEGDDRDVVIALDQVTALGTDGDRDLQTALTADQMRALPAWNRETMRGPGPRMAGTSGTGM